MVLCKFHSVFLSQKGQVFTCGHGQGGRLGHGDEQTYLVSVGLDVDMNVTYTIHIIKYASSESQLAFYNRHDQCL